MASRTVVVASTTSGPMPSPGRRTMWWAMRLGRHLGGDGTAALARGLVGGDRVLLLQRQPDVVQAVDQAVMDVAVQVEGDLLAVEAHDLVGQVDLAFAVTHDRRDDLLGQHDRQQADLRAVGVEDVGEARRDDRAEAVVLQAPRGVLARGAAAEVLTRDEDRVLREVPARLVAPVVEQELAEARALDALEELLG